MDNEGYRWRKSVSWMQSALLSSKAIKNNEVETYCCCSIYPLTSPNCFFSVSSFPRLACPPPPHIMSFSMSWWRCVNNSARLPVCLLWQLQVGELAQREWRWGVLFTAFLWSASVGEHNGIVLNPQMQNRLLWAVCKHFPIWDRYSCIFHKCSFQHIQLLLLSQRYIIHELGLILRFVLFLFLFSQFVDKG